MMAEPCTAAEGFVPVVAQPHIGGFKRLQRIAGGYRWAILGMGLGWLAWSPLCGEAALLWLLGLPVGFAFAPSRRAVFLFVAGYYLSGARGLPGGAAVFFGDAAPWWQGWALWAGTNVVLALPFAVLWSPTMRRPGRRFVIATLLVALPPLGFIGWCNPLLVAGTLFPGMRWIGFVMTMIVVSWIASIGVSWAMRRRLIYAAVVALVANLVWQAPPVPANWLGVNTGFPRLSSGGTADAGALLGAFRRVRWLAQNAERVPAGTTVVLPETLLGPFGAVAESTLAQAEEVLRAKGSRILAGAELVQPDGRYINALVVLGAGALRDGQRVVIRQGIPVPLAMWNPFAKDGALINLWAYGSVADIADVRAAALICYEQFLPWAMGLRAAQQPSVLLAVSNVWWARETSIPAIQAQTVGAFARLFRIPMVSAINSGG